ncbi:MAG: nitroreductase family protein [Elusimicrobiota bacterium]
MKKRSKIIDCILKRRSIRNLKSDPIPENDIEIMLRCLEAAPSAGNLQPWFFYVIRSQEIKKRLCHLSFDQKVVEQAPVVFAICAKPEESAIEYGDVGRNLFCIQDAAAAVQNLLLAVHDMGYGAVWIGIVKEKEIAECIGLPQGMRPMALVPVGIANEKPGKMERKGWKKVSKVVD